MCVRQDDSEPPGDQSAWGPQTTRERESGGRSCAWKVAYGSELSSSSSESSRSRRHRKSGHHRYRLEYNGAFWRQRLLESVPHGRDNIPVEYIRAVAIYDLTARVSGATVDSELNCSGRDRESLDQKQSERQREKETGKEGEKLVLNNPKSSRRCVSVDTTRRGEEHSHQRRHLPDHLLRYSSAPSVQHCRYQISGFGLSSGPRSVEPASIYPTQRNLRATIRLERQKQPQHFVRRISFFFPNLLPLVCIDPFVPGCHNSLVSDSFIPTFSESLHPTVRRPQPFNSTSLPGQRLTE